MKKLILTSCFACRNIVKAGIFLLVISSVSEKSFSQNTKTDSLKAELKTATHDTTKVKILNNLSRELKSNNPAQALNYAKQALKIAKSPLERGVPKGRGVYKKLIANSYNNIGIVHKNQGNYEKAIMYYQKSLKIYEKLGDSPDEALASSGKRGMGISYNNIGNVHNNQGNYEKAIMYFQKYLKICEELSDSPDEALAQSGKRGMGLSYNNIGNVHYHQGNYEKAIMYYQKSLKILEELGDKKGMGASYNNIGSVHKDQGNYEKAIMYYQKSLKICEELGDKRGMGISYNNIGIVHDYQGNYEKALMYYQKSLKICEELGDKRGMGISYNNIGIVHDYQGNYEEAIMYYQKYLKISEELGDKRGMDISYNNIGNVHYSQNKYSEALKYYQKSLKISEELGNKQGIAMTLGNIASLNNKQENFHKAIEFAERSLEITREIGALYLEMHAYGYLSESYEGLNNTGKALEYYKLYTEAKDSLFNEEKNKQITEMETRYQTEKKEQQLKLQETQLAQKEAEVKKKNIQRNAFIGGFALVLLLAIVIFRSYRQQKKQKAVIALKNKNITDSINYAVRIQQAILPSEDFTNEILGEHFILFKPKDIVSGDFYWAAKIKNWLIVAAVDCTGHGVPGAFMSMLGVSFLNEIVRKEEITQPNQVLNELREYVISSLQQKKSPSPGPFPKGRGESPSHMPLPEGGEKKVLPFGEDLGGADVVKDGMDMSLIVIDTETNKMQFAGANNPLYIVRREGEHESKKVGSRQLAVGNEKEVGSQQSAVGNNHSIIQSFNHSLIEIKADKMPIGIHEEMKEFTNNELQLQKGDTLYIFSDGYPDQFGGEKGKKFKYKPFKELFLSIQSQTMEEQKAILDRTFMEWKGDLFQVDDVVVIGIRV